jgi:hypothetical protein
MFKKAKEISDDKVQIAIQTYELVDKHIRKLDSDLAKFESEMKVIIVVMNVLVSMRTRIRIQLFRSMRIRIQIQGFDDQKLKKNYSRKKIFF